MKTWTNFDLEFIASSYAPAQFLEWEEPGATGKLSHYDRWMLATEKGNSINWHHSDPWTLWAKEIHLKFLNRGVSAFPQEQIEVHIQDLGRDSSLPLYLPSHASGGNSSKSPSLALRTTKEVYTSFDGFWTPASADILDKPDFNALDPKHPENERRLLSALFDRFGPTLASFVYPQAPLDKLLNIDSQSHVGQRVDFVLCFPNNRGLVLEPGDHDQQQAKLDDERDRQFLHHHQFKTLRPTNAELETEAFLDQVHGHLEEIGALCYLRPEPSTSPMEVSPILAGPWINRFETILVKALLNPDVIQRNSLVINVIERDLAATELGLYSFLRQQEKIHALYGRPFQFPRIEVKIFNSSGFAALPAFANAIPDRLPLIERHDQVPDVLPPADLTIDICVTYGTLLPPISPPPESALAVCRNFPFHTEPRNLRSESPYHPVPDHGEKLGEILTPFLRDLFRKEQFRDGQVAILASLLAGRDTIGLLPTGGGKSLCYQLAGMLSPGTTIVISPIIALMEDQVESLKSRYRITACAAINSASKQTFTEGAIIALAEQSAYTFISPERFQRQPFRDALESLQRFRHPVNLAVIDEAHCVSIWGHDFRPSYLRLPDCIRSLCRSAKNSPPPIAALTGTASQVVLIDLKRILGIERPDSIIRPTTFDRKELTFHVRHCKNQKDAKIGLLKRRILPDIAAALGKKHLTRESFGIIFDYSPKSLWKLLKQLDPKSAERIEAFSGKVPDRVRSLEMYTGSCPFNSKNTKGSPPAIASRWDEYKRIVFRDFTRGKVRCLLGNNAISVGIDHPHIEYVVNMAMPQSLEDYYQQAGRAGRSGQKAFCYLLYAESRPEVNDQWFEGKGNPEEYSDVSNAAFYHKKNFPGQDKDSETLIKVMKAVRNEMRSKQSRSIAITSKSAGTTDDSLERFLGYLILIGLIEDYTIQGAGGSENFHLTMRREIPVTKSATKAAREPLLDHVVQSLSDYYSRYFPMPVEELRARFIELAGESGSRLEAACHHFVTFLYERIEYQRRAAMKLITQYCRDAVDDEHRARQIIRDTFDRSRFSDRLSSIQQQEVNFSVASDLLSDIQDRAEAEQVFWETGRLLSDVDRPDWRFIQAFARLRADPSPTQIDETVKIVLALLSSWTSDVLLHFVTTVQAFHLCDPAIPCEMVERVFELAYADPAHHAALFDAISSPAFPQSLHGPISLRLTLNQLRKANEYIHQ